MPVSSIVSRLHACSRFSPVSTNPADTENRLLCFHARLCCNSRRSFASTTVQITAGSTRGNSMRWSSDSLVQRCAQPDIAGSVGAPQCGQCRCMSCQLASESIVTACPISRELACGANMRRSTQSNRSTACSNMFTALLSADSRASTSSPKAASTACPAAAARSSTRRSSSPSSTAVRSNAMACSSCAPL